MEIKFIKESDQITRLVDSCVRYKIRQCINFIASFS